MRHLLQPQPLAHRLFAIVLIVYVGLCGYLIYRIAPFAAPNEGLHYEYVAILRDTHALPPSSANADERHQPPIYYTVAALLSGVVDQHQQPEFQPNPHFASTARGNHNPVVQPAPTIYAARWASVLFGLIGVIAIFLVGCWAGRPLLGVLAAGVLAFQPNYLYLSASIGNDVPVAAATACILAVAVRIIQQPSTKTVQRGVWLGAFIAVGLLIKANAIIMAIALPITWWVEYKRGGAKPALMLALASSLSLAALYAPWVIYNQLRNDPLGLAKSLPLRRVLLNNPLDFGLLWPYLARSGQSIWLDWSPGEIGYAPTWVYLLAAGVALVALAGWLLLRQHKAPSSAIMLLGLVPVGIITYLYVATKTLALEETRYFVPEGRWMLPAFPIFAWAIAGGWWRWWPAQRKALATSISLVLYAGVTLAMLVWHLPWIQPNARVLSVGQIPPAAQTPHLRYAADQPIELSAINAPNATLGQAMTMQLYWQTPHTPAHNYTIDTQLQIPNVDRWTTLATVRTYPGYGSAPIAGWPIDRIIADEVTLYPSSTITLNGPTRAFVIVRVVDLAQNTTLSVTRDGAVMDAPVAQEIAVRPTQSINVPSQSVLAQPVQFGAAIQLAAIQSQRNGDMLDLTLWWQAKANPNADLIAFVHVLDNKGQLLAQHDGVPNDSLSPTHFWQAGDVVRDERRIAVSASGPFTLRIGLYNAANQERVPAMQGQEPLPDNMLLMALP